MTRLTEKNDKVFDTMWGKHYITNFEEKLILNKLGQLEDIEEKLECPLEFIFKVLSADYIYIEGMNARSEYDKSFKFHSKSNNYIINPYAIAEKKSEFLFVYRWGGGYDLRIKDYKKTWWLKEDKSE